MFTKTYLCIIGQIGHCVGGNFNIIPGRGRLVHLFKWGDYRKVELSLPRVLSHIYL